MALSSSAVAGVFSIVDPLALDKKRSFSLNTKAFIADDPVSLNDLFNRWHGDFHPRSGANLALDDMRADIGFSLKNWGYFGYTYRHQSLIKANRDTVLLTWQQLNDTGFIPGKVYTLDISINGFETDGIVYAKRVDVIKSKDRSLKLGLGFELLRGKNMQEGYLKGDALANSSKDYDFNAVSDYRYTQNYLYNLDVQMPTGYGYTTHATIDYRIKNLSFRFIANDLYGKIKWKRVPYSYVNINSSNKKYDDNGFVVYNPTVSGVEKYVNYTQRLYGKYRVEASYRYDTKSGISTGGDFVKGIWFPYLNFSYIFTDSFYSTISYERRFKSVGIDINYKDFLISLKSDSVKDPSAIALALSCLISF